MPLAFRDRSPSLTRLLLVALAILPCLYGGRVHAQSVIDVAVFYTTAAKDSEGGKTQIETKIDEMVAATNTAYADSGVNQTIKLVAVEGVAYTEASQQFLDLRRLKDLLDGYMDEVHTIRDRAWADVVMLLRSGQASSGLAVQMNELSTDFAPLAFGAAVVQSGVFMHELGHIMGLHHDRYVDCRHASGTPECPPAVTPYAYGYVNQASFDPKGSTTLDPDAPETAHWRTIMAYPNQCLDAEVPGNCRPALLRFSNPNQIYPDPGGDPMGKAGTQTTTDVDGPADAARTLNETRTTVADFRQGRAVKVSFAAGSYTVTEGGTVTGTVELDAAPGRTLDIPIPLTATSTDGAWPGDYSLPESVTFSASQTTETFTFQATQDTREEDTETVTLGFGTPLPAGVSVGSQATATVTLTDNDTVSAAPSVSTVSLISDPEAAYAAGEEIVVAVVFTKPISVTGTPSIELMVGANTRTVQCQDAASEVLTCTYTVVAGESDTDGVSVVADSLALNGGTIQDAETTPQDATLTHPAVAADSDHTVDGGTPDVESATVDGDILTLTYDETLDKTSVPWANAFTVQVGSATELIASVLVSGAVVTLTLVSEVVHTDSVTLSYSPSSGSPSLRDEAGNAAATPASYALTNNTPQPVYDTDDDGLIEIENLAQLNAMRHDLDGNGTPTTAGATVYDAAFPDATRVVCGVTSGGCAGYELTADLDFDTDGDGQVDADDTYWDSGAGWQPIGTESDQFRTTFEGNGRAIRHLFIQRSSSDDVGLFGYTGLSSVIRHARLHDVAVQGNYGVGGLAGTNQGSVTESSATGRVEGEGRIGGLVGINFHEIHASYATVRVVGGQDAGGLVGQVSGDISVSYATGRVSGTSGVGGLGGRMTDTVQGTIQASYATGSVSGNNHIGGLVGSSAGGTIQASYATGRVASNGSAVGGLVGENLNNPTITASYWDTHTAGRTSSAGGTGQTTTALQTPTGYSGIYAAWNVDLDGHGTNDDPWDFGTSSQYPALQVDFDGDETASWQEFGQQLRESPTLTPDTSTVGQVDLSWTAVTNDAGSAAVTYTVTRGDTPLAEDLSTTTYTDTDVTSGSAYHYQVIALVDGGEATRSARLPVTATANQKPAFDEGSSAMRSVDENTASGVDIGDPVAATDTDDTSLIYTLGGTDAASFALNTSTGQLQTQAALNYEAKNRYTVTISVRDDKDDDGEADTATDDTITVTITVGNLDEAGTVTLSGTVQELHQLTAALSDPDTVSGTPTWQWARSATSTGPWTDLAMATAPQYTPGATDVDQYLRATATYTDGQGSGKRAAAVTARVQAAPVVTLHLSDPAISEDGTESSTVTATLDTASSAVTTVTVMAPTSDVTLSGSTLTIAAGETASTGTVTLTAVNNDIDGPETKTVPVSGTTTNSLVRPPAPVTLTIEDDDPAPTVALVLSPVQIREDDKQSAVTATLNHPSIAETTVTVSAAAVSPAVAGDFMLSTTTTLTIPAGKTASEGTAVTLTSVDNDTDAPDKQVTVRGTATNTHGIAGNPADATLLITDDEGPPTVTLAVADNSITESGGGNRTTVRATLNHPSSAVTTVAVTATAVPPAVAGDFTLSGASLTIPAGQTESSGGATLTAQDNAEDEADKQVRVTARASNTQGVRATTVAAVTVTITDDDPPEVKGEGAPTYVEGGTGPVATYTASNPANASLTWSLAGSDADTFTLANGVLRFRQSPDYEDPNNPAKAYDITVQASDGTLTGALPVLVTVEDALGMVRLSASQPRVGSALTATVSDPDGVDPATTEWCWEWSASIAGATTRLTCDSTNATTTATYTPVETDLGRHLWATVTYTDNQGTPKREAVKAVTTNTILAQTTRGGGGGGGGGGESPDDHGNTPAQATRVRLDPTRPTSIPGQINTPDDVDYFALPLPRAGVLVAETTGATDTVGTVWQDNVLLAQADSGGARQNFRLRAPVQAGPVVLAVAGNGRQTGAYTVETRLLSGYLENPGDASFQSGVGVLSGWVCDADMVEIELNGVPQEAAYGTERLDTAGVCGDVDNGFGLLFNWNRLGDGEHEVVAFVDGVEFSRATVTVTTLGAEFVRGVSGECTVADFPSGGETVRLVWQEAQQNFVLAAGSAPMGPTHSGTAGVGYLENPSPHSFQSGIGVVSGWVCEADTVELEIGHTGRQVAGYGTERLDTLDVCGDTDNGFGLLFNWNLLGDGEHEVIATVDGIELGRATVRVTTLGEEFVRGVAGECTVDDFPSPGETVTLAWQQNHQNFVITTVE